ncbi:MAG: hypothetical protein ACYTEQ_26840 [Planctomycetota bacterium]|jgi:hypothetical protein
MTPAEIQNMTKDELLRLAGKHLCGPGPWTHKLVATGFDQTKYVCVRCEADWAGDIITKEVMWAPGHKGTLLFSADAVCPIPPPATGSWADIAEGLRQHYIREYDEYTAVYSSSNMMRLSNLRLRLMRAADAVMKAIDAPEEDWAEWMLNHATLEEQIKVRLLAALEGQ